MGLFSRIKKDRKKWTCELCTHDLSINDIGAVIRDDQVIKLEKRNRNVAEHDKVLCQECSQGNLSKDHQIKFAEFANKALHGHGTITLAEVTDVLKVLEIFIGRLSAYKPYFNKRIEELRSNLGQILKISAFPKLKQEIVRLIENKKYDEAEALCARGSHWNGLIEEKGKWEDDLQQIQLLIEISKSSSGKEKIIEAPEGFQKTVTLNTQTGPEVEKYDCFLCKKKVTKSEIGMIFRSEDVFVFTGGTSPPEIKSSDDVLCASCAPKWLAINELKEMGKKGEHPTVDKLRYFMRLWNAGNPDEIPEVKKPVVEEKLPSNATRYNWVGFNKNNILEFKASCPKCSGQLNMVKPKKYEDEPSRLVKLFEDYLAWPAELPAACPSCKETITIHK